MKPLSYVYDDMDWQHIFENYALPTHVRTKKIRNKAYALHNVKEILAVEDGENDGADWVGVFIMNDAKFLTIRAGCDCTGWGCQEGGGSEYADTKEDAVAFGLTQEERERLGFKLEF